MTEYSNLRCIAANGKFCRKPVDGACANTQIQDAGLNSTDDASVGFCPSFSSGISSDPCSTVRCAAGFRCVQGLCSDACNICGTNQCNLTVSNAGVVSATCGGAIICPTPACAAPPTGCQYQPNPLEPCGCGRLVCACLNRCGPREVCNNAAPSASCVCSPGDKRPLCPNQAISPTNVQTCASDGLSWTPARSANCSCSERPCVAPAGCIYVPREDVAADQDGCRRNCTTQYRILCRPESCFNCSTSAQVCTPDVNFNTDGSVSLTVVRPVCRCLPGSSFSRGCITYTCNPK